MTVSVSQGGRGANTGKGRGGRRGITTKECWEEVSENGSFRWCKVIGYTADYALEMLPFLLIPFLQPDECALGGGAGCIGESGNASGLFGDFGANVILLLGSDANESVKISGVDWNFELEKLEASCRLIHTLGSHY